MDDKEIRKRVDEAYKAGLRNGSILMKNKILKSLNRDLKLFSTASAIYLLPKIMRKVQRIKHITNDKNLMP